MIHPAARALSWGLAIGTAFYLYWYGTAALDPTNVEWMSRGDPATTFLGWHFFRFEPWTFPLGLVHNYGEGMATSVIVTDSLPFIAIALKPISALLPEQFQYFGWWVLACMVLNAATAYALLARFTGSAVARIVGAALVTTAPLVIWRGVWHMSLVAHWQLLLALLLYLAPNRRSTWLAWGALLALSGLTVAYIFAMVGAVWAAALAKAMWVESPRAPPAAIVRIATLTIAVSGLLFWIAGVFSIAGHAGIGGYGYNQLDILAFFDSRGFTRLHPGFAKGLVSGIEDFQYLGLGSALAVVLSVALWSMRPAPLPRHFVPLVAVALMLVAFAITHRVTFAGRVLFELPVPQALLDVATIFRSSARMGWLFGYLMLVWSLVTIAERMPRAWAAVVLSGLLLVNGIDASTDRPRTNAATRYAPPPIMAQQAAFVAALPEQYRRLVWVPKVHLWTDNIHEIWGYAAAAAPRRMAMNLAYVARYDAQAFMRAQQHGIDTAMRGPVDAGAVYVTRNPVLVASLLRVGGAGTMHGKLGDDFVVVPRTASGAGLAGLRADAFPIASGAAVFDAEFGSASAGRFFLAGGWSQPHVWGTWSEGDEASLVVPAPTSIASGAPGTLKVYGHVYSHHGPQVVDVVVNGVVATRWRITPSPQPQWHEAPIAPGIAGGDAALRVDFRIGNPQRPADAPQVQWADRRRLGLALMRLRIE